MQYFDCVIYYLLVIKNKSFHHFVLILLVITFPEIKLNRLAKEFGYFVALV